MKKVMGAVSKTKLLEIARNTSEPVPYYYVLRGSICKRYIYANGFISRNPETKIAKGRMKLKYVKRFTNYWYAYAYKCQLDALKRQEEPND